MIAVKARVAPVVGVLQALSLCTVVAKQVVLPGRHAPTPMVARVLAPNRSVNPMRTVAEQLADRVGPLVFARFPLV